MTQSHEQPLPLLLHLKTPGCFLTDDGPAQLIYIRKNTRLRRRRRPCRAALFHLMAFISKGSSVQQRRVPQSERRRRNDDCAQPTVVVPCAHARARTHASRGRTHKKPLEDLREEWGKENIDRKEEVKASSVDGCKTTRSFRKKCRRYLLSHDKCLFNCTIHIKIMSSLVCRSLPNTELVQKLCYCPLNFCFSNRVSYRMATCSVMP